MPDFYDKFAGFCEDKTPADIDKFKRLFRTDDGLFVLGKILEKCKFMEPCENERDMALNNFAKELLATVFWDKKKGYCNIHSIIDFVRNWRK